MHSKKDLLHKINEITEKTNDDYELLKMWIKDFTLADITREDKIDLLRYGRPAFINLKKYTDTNALKAFFTLIVKRRFLDAVRFTQYMAYEYSENRQYVKDIVKSRDIYLLSPKLEMKMGGLGHIVRHRANYLAEAGYKVTMLNTATLKNYPYIQNHYKSTNQLHENVNFINYLEYYSLKNSNSKTNPTLDDIISENESETVKDDYRVEKLLNDDDSVTLNYCLDGEVKVSELYIDKCRVYVKDDDGERYYTPDGFKFFDIKNKKEMYLFERESGMVLYFRYRNEFLNYFITEVALKGEKPFIICDSTRQWYNMNGIKLEDAFKIGGLHGNPFVDFDPEKGIHPHVTHFKNVESYDKVAILTKKAYDDIVKAGIDEKYLTIIPNFVLDEFAQNESCEKDTNKITVFSRINESKQFSHMIQAFSMICDKHEKAYLDIFGEAGDADEMEEQKRLEALIKELNLEDRVHLKGYIQDVSGEMKNSLFSLLTSRNEGFPMSTIEVMANSVPTIAYDFRYGPSDLITNNVDGILIEKDNIKELAEAMDDLLNNPQKAIEMGKAAKEKIRNNFTRSAVCPMWEDLFIDVFIEDEIDDAILRLNLEDTDEKILKELDKVKKENVNLKNKNDNLLKSNEELSKFKKDVLSSKSWKITRPLRRK